MGYLPRMLLTEFSSLSDIRCTLIYLLASYNSQIGRPTGLYSGTIEGLLADDVLVPAAFVAVTEQL